MNRFEIWLVAWVELIESVITIITFGFVDPGWSYNMVFYFALKEAKKRATIK
jgi:hypothetical protein